MRSSSRLPLAQTENLIIRKLKHETLVYDRTSDQAHCLNQTAALVWQHCDGKTSVTKMVSLLKKDLGPKVDEDLVWLTIAQLQRFHLLADSPVPVRRVSRRDLVLKYAPLALALPVIASISAPAAAQAGTCFPIGAACAIDNQCCTFNCNVGVCGPQLKPPPQGSPNP